MSISKKSDPESLKASSNNNSATKKPNPKKLLRFRS